MPNLQVASINHPCGSLTAPAVWSRTRKVSRDLRDHELWLVWGGRGWMSNGTDRRSLRTGSCVWMRPGGIYDAGHEPSHPLRIIYIHFTPHNPQAAIPEYFDTSTQPHVLAIMRTIVDRVPRAAMSDRGETAPVRDGTIGLLEALLSDLLELQKQPKREAADAAVREIAEKLWHSDEPAPTVEQLAEIMCVTASHFSRQFKQAMGLSPQQWIIEARLQRGRVLLRESSLSIQQISDSLGYCDSFAFSKQFKRFTGQSPSAYRRSDGAITRQTDP